MSKKVIIKNDYFDKLIIENEHIEVLEFHYCSFKKYVSIINCKIKNASFQAAYFENGLLIKDSEFINSVDFSLGDTVKTGSKFKLENVIFNEYVSFQDYNFQGKVELINIQFKKGTNLFGNKNTPVEIIFKSEPILNNVIGKLDVDDFII